MRRAPDRAELEAAVLVADLLDVSRLLSLACELGASEIAIAQLQVLRRAYAPSFAQWRDCVVREANGDRVLWGSRLDSARALACEIRGQGTWVPGQDGAPHAATLH